MLDPASGASGLDSVSDEILAELPEDCRQAFEQARREERAWKRGVGDGRGEWDEGWFEGRVDWVAALGLLGRVSVVPFLLG